jgi:hypothetical protein
MPLLPSQRLCCCCHLSAYATTTAADASGLQAAAWDAPAAAVSALMLPLLLLPPLACRLLVKTRAERRPAEFKRYHTLDHVLLGRVNELAIKAGVPEPYTHITRPAQGATQDMYLGGFLAAPTSAARAAASADAAATAAGSHEVRTTV